MLFIERNGDNMAHTWPTVGIGHAPAYQVAAVPWVTSSIWSGGAVPLQFGFDQVTKYIQIHNHSTGGSKHIHVGFTEAGLLTEGNYFRIDSGETRIVDCRTTRIFISGSVTPIPYDIIAGLTSIPTNQMPILTGSNGFNGVG